jgi:hypothetical protein
MENKINGRVTHREKKKKIEPKPGVTRPRAIENVLF